MRYASINNCDIINTIKGVAVSLWVQGCPHACDDCFNSETWNLSGGKAFDDRVESRLFEALSSEYVSTFSVLGGEPLSPQNAEAVLNIISKVRFLHPEMTIMIWTGYKFDDISKYDLSNVDYIIDGKYEKNNPTKKKLRGSDNQVMWHKVNGRWGKVID